jgi:hypothetical protein
MRTIATAANEAGSSAASPIAVFGSVITGAGDALTLTVNERVLVCPTASVALHDTVVAPRPNAEPDAGRHVTASTAPRSSVATGGAYETTAPSAEVGAAETSAWAAIDGDWAS